MTTATTTPELLRVPFTAHGLKVDREKKIIFGLPLAQLGPFKSEGRGEFDMQSLQAILTMAQAAPRGLKSRLAHPNESNDSIDKTLGRFRDPRLDTVAAREHDGQLRTDLVPAVLADLHFNPAASKVAFDMADYVMTLAETDSALFSTSLVLQTEQETRLNPNGTPMLGPDGEPLPPLWRPTKLMACDCVSDGDACDGLLARMGGTVETLSSLPNGVVFQAVHSLDKQFAGKPRAFVEGHCLSFLRRYLDRRFGSLAAGESPQAALLDVLAVLRGQTWLYHTLHWQSVGANFYGQHLLFERLYESLPPQYDPLAEKSVALFGPGAVEPVGAILAAAGHLSKWTGDPLAAGMASETDLAAAITEALDQADDNAGLTNFLQGLADEHQTNVYLLQQVQGGKKPEEAMAACEGHALLAAAWRHYWESMNAGFLTRKQLSPLLKGILRMPFHVPSLAAGDDLPGSPNAHDHPDDIPEGSGPEPNQELAKHNGCHSTLGYHHVTLCRLCGGTIQACGCDHVEKESRVVTMSKEPCAACLAAAAVEDSGPAGGNIVGEKKPDDAPLAEDGSLAVAKAKMFCLTELD